jgi:hypothetical protein
MKKEICGTFHAKCGTRDLRKFSGLSRERRDEWSPYQQSLSYAFLSLIYGHSGQAKPKRGLVELIANDRVVRPT